MSDSRDQKEVSRLARELTQRLAAEGKIMEGGWAGYRMLMNPAAGAVQIDETRMAFYAGAHHLFASIMSILDVGTEPTAKDLRQIDLIHRELEAFLVEYKRKHGLA